MIQYYAYKLIHENLFYQAFHLEDKQKILGTTDALLIDENMDSNSSVLRTKIEGKVVIAIDISRILRGR